MPLKPIKAKKRYQDKINYILKHGDSEAALDLAMRLNKRLPVLEPVILKNYGNALEYAIIILSGHNMQPLSINYYVLLYFFLYRAINLYAFISLEKCSHS